MARCEATVTSPGRENTGGQCKRNSVRGTTRCERHGGVEEGERRGLTVSHEPDAFRQVCTSLKRDGMPCSKWAIRGGFVCRTHGGHMPNVQQAARKRMLALLPLALQRLQGVLESPESSDADRLRAIGMVLDRSGMGPQSEVLIGEKPWELLLKPAADGGIFKRVRDDMRSIDPMLGAYAPVVDYDDVLDAEAVDDAVEPLTDDDVATVVPIKRGSASPPRGSRMAAQAKARNARRR